MTEAEQIVKVCKWLGLSTEGMSDIVSVDGVQNTQRWADWWSREGCIKALEAWIHAKRGARSYTHTADVDGHRLYLWEFRNEDEETAMNRGRNFTMLSTAALAALTEAMNNEIMVT